MEFKGTPGNWKFDGKPFSENEIIVFSEEQGFILGLHPANFKTDEEIKANALLISKAPEMLEMFVKISDECDGNNFSIFRDEIEQLIKQATEL